MSYRLPTVLAGLILTAALAAPAAAEQSVLLRDQETIRVEFEDPATGGPRVDTFVVKYLGWVGSKPETLGKGQACRSDTWIERRFYLRHPLTGEQSINSRYSRILVSSDREDAHGVRRTLCGGEKLASAKTRLAEVFPRVIEEDRGRLVQQLKEELAVENVTFVN